MEFKRFGSTDLEVSRVGLGCGGHSRLGLVNGGVSQASSIVSHAMDLGINFFDTARIYGTEEIVGEALKGKRSECVISTKTLVMDRQGSFLSPDKIVGSLEKSLSRLRTDYVDIFNLHGVRPEELDFCLENYLEPLLREVAKGKIRYLGITELFGEDTRHEMLEKVLEREIFDSLMVGFNLLNPSARKKVFPLCVEKNVGTQIMFSVRRALSNPEHLKKTVGQLIENNEVDETMLDKDNPLQFLMDEPGVRSVVDAAYRFCIREPGVDVVLTGTGSKEHLSENVRALTGPVLSDDLLQRLEKIFGGVTTVSGD
ncbi:MAG: aldo/keto reductase [Gammaproteobacteria bacterium]|nr:aldo/keto reductase [Gammaproteobacteria bacterium]